MKSARYQWAAPGDVNAFFGLMLDNIAGLVLTVTMLASIFKFPVDFALAYMIPGTAIGVLVGDLLYFWLAFRLAHKEQRSDVTAMPLGLDTPSTIGMVLFVLGPAFSGKIAALAKGAGYNNIEELRSAVADPAVAADTLQLFNQINHEAATYAWHIGICAIVITGIVKGLLAIGSNWLRDVFPRAGLLGSLLAIALVLIAFIQLQKLSTNPVVGFASLVIVMATLMARGRLPFRIPGALGAVMIGCIIWYLLMGYDAVAGTSFAHPAEAGSSVWFPVEWLTVFTFSWTSVMGDAIGFLPYIIPFAIATVIGGIDCTESAASAGDNFDTRQIIGVEAAATTLAGMCGGVIQTTPYIGHPAYKFMGGRAAYVLATAAFVGGAGIVGYFSLLFQLIPEAAVLPILVFIGIEITAQSFLATPRRHYAALAIACLPALAKLVMIYLDQFVDYSAMDREQKVTILSLRMLAGGFIITSLIWASAMARIVDRRFFSASLYFAVGGMLSLFGIMHSPWQGDKMYWPWNIGEEPGTMEVNTVVQQAIYEFSVAYLVMAILMFALGWIMKPEPITSDKQYEAIDGH